MSRINNFFAGLRGKRIAVCGIGNNNIPVIHQLLEQGAIVTACDRRTAEQLDVVAAELEKAGASLCLGEGYLNSICECGADMILRTPGMKPYLPEFELAREAGITVTSEMEIFLELCPANITAITGSDGKTTTTAIIAGLLEAAGRRVHTGGNFGRALLPVLPEIDAEDDVVIELSSFQLTGMTQSPHTAVVTNISPNHLDWHTDMQEYIEAKRNLIAWQSSGDRAVLNADDEITASFAGSTRGDIWWFSRKRQPERGAWTDGEMLMLNDGNGDIPVIKMSEIKLPGTHNVENYLAAFAAVCGRVPVKVMAEFARGFGGVAHRCEFVREVHGVKWYNDSIGTSPTRTIAGLRAFDKKVILIAGGYDKNIPYTPLGPVCAERVKGAILMGATADAIEAAIHASSEVPVYRVPTMAEAVKKADEIAEKGDIVFMSPASASFDMYKNFEERGEDFRKEVSGLREV